MAKGFSNDAPPFELTAEENRFIAVARLDVFFGFFVSFDVALDARNSPRPYLRRKAFNRESIEALDLRFFFAISVD